MMRRVADGPETWTVAWSYQGQPNAAIFKCEEFPDAGFRAARLARTLYESVEATEIKITRALTERWEVP